MSDREFRVLKTLGGCGGTIVSRALAANGAIVLSEVNPRSAHLFANALNPLTQLRRNYPMLVPDSWLSVDVHAVGRPDVFGRLMTEIINSSDRPVVIRDYSYIEYIGTPFVWPTPEQPSLDAALLPYGSMRTVLLVRRPSTSLRSLLRHNSLQGTLTQGEYLLGYIRFMKAHPTCPVIRFEDFCANPEDWMEAACSLLNIPYQPQWMQKLAEAPPLTGNALAIESSTIATTAASSLDNEIIRPDLKPLWDELSGLCGY